MMDLLVYNVGKGLCHAWYARRFLESVSVMEMQLPHSGLGLDCYVQWSSPIRRFSDLQVHASVKRYLRRRRVYELLRNGQPIPEGVTAFDLGVPAEAMGKDGRFTKDTITTDDLDSDINYLEGAGLVGAARKLQQQSQQYWLFEYIRRQKEVDPNATFSLVVLGCVDPEKQQYAVYVTELGLEHRYTSPGGRLDPGAELLVKVDNVSPRSGLLSFVRVV
jgi:exoribonuclease R